MHRVLLIAYHFPPLRESSGLQRTLKLAQYLPEFGWTPAVLTVNPRAYQAISTDHNRIPEELLLRRSFALDAKRHLSIRQRHLRFTALPDRWASWWPFGVLDGLRLIRQFKPSVIFSTYPIATAHLIGLSLHRLTGLPWIADTRDPLMDDYYPEDRMQRAVHRYLERNMMRFASRIVFTTPGTLQTYVERYPAVPERHYRVIANGYDEDNFLKAEAKPSRKLIPGTLTLVHSGLLSRSDRNPIPFFQALSRLKKEGRIQRESLRVILRASGDEDSYAQELREYAIDDIVDLPPPIAYEDALREMLDADGLLLFQGASCNRQIPAKAYEYLRARRPVFALTNAGSNTADLLREAAIDSMADIADAEDIFGKLRRFLEALKRGDAPVASEVAIARYSRRGMTAKFSELLNEIVEENSGTIGITTPAMEAAPDRSADSLPNS
jgi:glycosyltransferase involved in cell wall biosynthesis